MESIKLVETDKEILACYAVLQQLHESLREDNIISHVCRLESNGCKLVFLLHSAIVKSLAGFFSVIVFHGESATMLMTWSAIDNIAAWVMERSSLNSYSIMRKKIIASNCT